MVVEMSWVDQQSRGNSPLSPPTTPEEDLNNMGQDTLEGEVRIIFYTLWNIYMLRQFFKIYIMWWHLLYFTIIYFKNDIYLLYILYYKSPVFFQLENIRNIIHLTKEYIDDLNSQFAGIQHPPSLYLSVSKLVPLSFVFFLYYWNLDH